MCFKTNFADLTIKIDANYPTMEKFCKDYLVEDGSVEFEVSVTEDEIKREDQGEYAGRYSMQYLETLAIQRKISEKLPDYNRFLMHGAVISHSDKAYMFTALSGTGKTTHIRLWRKYLGEAVQIINGDKPFLHVKEDGVIVYGTPWAGKEGWHRNVSAALGGICFIKQGKVNRIRKLEPAECLTQIFQQIYFPKDSMRAGKTLELLDQMLKLVPVYLLECDMSEEAVKTSFEAMTGLNYSEYRMENGEDED